MWLPSAPASGLMQRGLWHGPTALFYTFATSLPCYPCAATTNTSARCVSLHRRGSCAWGKHKSLSKRLSRATLVCHHLVCHPAPGDFTQQLWGALMHCGGCGQSLPPAWLSHVCVTPVPWSWPLAHGPTSWPQGSVWCLGLRVLPGWGGRTDPCGKPPGNSLCQLCSLCRQKGWRCCVLFHLHRDSDICWLWHLNCSLRSTPWSREVSDSPQVLMEILTDQLANGCGVPREQPSETPQNTRPRTWWHSDTPRTVQPPCGACKPAAAVQSRCLARSLCSPAITSSTAEAGGHGRGLPTRTLPGPCSGCLPRPSPVCRPSRLAPIRGWPCAGGLSLSLQWKQRQDLQCRHLMEIAPTKEAGKPAHPFTQKLGYLALLPNQDRGQEPPPLLTLSSAQPFPGFWAGWKVPSKPTAPSTLR